MAGLRLLESDGRRDWTGQPPWGQAPWLAAHPVMGRASGLVDSSPPPRRTAKDNRILWEAF